MPLAPRMGAWATSASRSTSASTVPNCCTRAAAVLGPTFGTPGTLSMSSPMSAMYSTTWSALTPSRSGTSASRVCFSFIESKSSTCSPTSCMKSLSPVMMRTLNPCSTA